MVCGSRHIEDREFIYGHLDGLAADNQIERLIVGDARGVDKIALEWAEARGVASTRYKADWLKLQRAAGPVRNQRMINDGKPDLVVAFWDGVTPGTRDATTQAVTAGVIVTIIPTGRQSNEDVH
jgi:hypothetical protein